MKKILPLLLLFSSLIPFSAQNIYPSYQDGKIWFKVKQNYRTLSSLNDNNEKLPIGTLPFLEKISKNHSIKNLSLPFSKAKKKDLFARIYLLEINDAEKIDLVINELISSHCVEYAEKVPLEKTSLTPNDPSLGSQWGLTKISATSAWNYFSANSNVIVAIVDDGVERTHPDLAASIWINTGDNNNNGIDDDQNGYIDDSNGWDVADNDNNPNPTTNAYDHGTHVAGIVGARSNNNIGVASIGFSVKIMPVKASNNPGSVNAGYNGIIYAVDNGADVINMSWGGYASSTTAQTIIDYAYNAGVVCIAAAGNDNLSTMTYPSGYNHVISVAASSSNDTKAGFSNYGSWVDITAPGQNIYSTTVGASYGNKSGTSMASPMVAGLAGLMLSLNPSLTVANIENCLKSTADNINAVNSGFIGQLGTGRINADMAMSCVSATLAWAPIADFSANFTTITAGGSVNFTNLSVYNPTSFSWSFQGGTPATSTLATPPSITYNTPGTYSVQLTASNANGTDSEVKTAYIIVNPASGCLKMNFPAPTTWSGTNYYTGATPGADGWVNGVNLYNNKEKAMYFDASASAYTKMTNVWIGFGRAYSSNPNKIVTIKIYDGSTGTPGALLGSSTVSMGTIMADVQGNFYTEVDFTNNPITLPASKRFFVSVDLTGLCWNCTPKDTLNIVSNTNGQTTPSAIWEKQSNNLWYQYGTANTWTLNASLYIHPWLTNEPSLSTFVPSATTICQGNTISFNGTGSTYQDTLLWYFPGGTPIISNNIVQTVNYNSPGNYNAILYVIGGGCNQFDSSFVNITVHPTPNIAISSANTDICPGASTTLTATGASGYSWTPPAGLNTTNGATVIASPLSNTQYNVTGINANGCSANAVIQIDVQQPTNAVISLPSTSGCQGIAFTYDGSMSTDADNFSWNIAGASPNTSTLAVGNAIFNTPGTYTVYLNTTNSCGSTDNDSMVVTINPITIPFITGPSSACVGDSLLFDASSSFNSSTYQWNFPGGSPASSNAVNTSTQFNTPGTYTVTLSTGNGCGVNSSATVVTINTCLGIQNNSNQHTLFYNPVNDAVTIEFSENMTSGTYILNIYNAIGQLVQFSSLDYNGNASKYELNLGSQSHGIYFVHFFKNEILEIKKIVK